MSHPYYRIAILSLFALALLIALTILNLVPPVSRDALTHHLALPKLYIDHGGMYETPDLTFSYYPMNLELLYLFSLKLGSEFGCKALHMMFGILTALLVFRLVRSLINTQAAMLAALFFITTPIVIKLSTSAYVDLGLTFFTTASFLFLFKWSQFRKTRFLVLAGVLAGAAAGAKYNGLIVIFLLTCFIPFLLPSKEKEKLSSVGVPIAIFLTCSILVVAPWFVRNIVWTGNPIFPLFQGVFGTGTNQLADGMNPFLIRKIAYNEPFWQTLLLPIRIFFQGQDNNPQYFDGVLNPFLLIFSLFCFYPAKTDHQKNMFIKFAFWFIVLFVTFTMIQRVIRVRYIVPVLPLISILAIIGLYRLKTFFARRFNEKRAGLLTLFLLICSFGYNLNYLFKYWQHVAPIDYLSGRISREAYISQFWPEYPVVDYANKNLPESAKILAVFLGNRGYYFDIPVKFDMNSGRSMICSLGRDAPDEVAVLHNLTDRGFTHLLIRQDLFSHYCLDQMEENDLHKMLTFFHEQTTVAYSVENFSLHTLKTDDM